MPCASRFSVIRWWCFRKLARFRAVTVGRFYHSIPAVYWWLKYIEILETYIISYRSFPNIQIFVLYHPVSVLVKIWSLVCSTVSRDPAADWHGSSEALTWCQPENLTKHSRGSKVTNRHKESFKWLQHWRNYKQIPGINDKILQEFTRHIRVTKTHKARLLVVPKHFRAAKVLSWVPAARFPPVWNSEKDAQENEVNLAKYAKWWKWWKFAFYLLVDGPVHLVCLT